MAETSLETSWSKVPESSVLPYFADFPVVMGKKFTFSDFGKPTYEQMLSALPTIVGPKETVVLHLGNGQSPVPFVQLDLDELFSLVTTKVRSESSSIVVEGNHNAFADMIKTAKEQGPTQARDIDFVHDFVYISFLEAVAAKVIKNFFKITNPFSGTPLILAGNRKLYTEDKQKREAAEKRLAKKAEKLATALESRASDLQRMKNAANSDNSGDYSSVGEDDVSCHGGRHSDTPPFSSSSDDESDEEFKGKSMPTDYVPPMDTRSSAALPNLGPILPNSPHQLVLPSVNPLGASLGSVPTFAVDNFARSHKKRKSAKKSKKHHKKSKHAKKSGDALAKSKPRVSVVKSAALSSSSSETSSSDDSTQALRNPQQVLFSIFLLLFYFLCFILLLSTTYPLDKHSWVTISQTENFQNSVLIKSF